MAKTYTVIRTNLRTEGTSAVTGSIEELCKSHDYTLEVGASWSHEVGNAKINRRPSTIAGLVKNLNLAVGNAAANGSASCRYSVL